MISEWRNPRIFHHNGTAYCVDRVDGRYVINGGTPIEAYPEAIRDAALAKAKELGL